MLAPCPARSTEGEGDLSDASELAGGQSEYVIIDVVEPWQVGVMVVDITKGEERDGGLMYYPPVKVAKVTVTSRFNGKVATGTTDEEGSLFLKRHGFEDFFDVVLAELGLRESGDGHHRRSSNQKDFFHIIRIGFVLF